MSHLQILSVIFGMQTQNCENNSKNLQEQIKEGAERKIKLKNIY